ncbi:MAG: type II secretion system F family protein [Hyphomicrobiaceae bacterium]
MSTRYYYDAVNGAGERQSGELIAASPEAVTEQLLKVGSYAIDIREAGANADGGIRQVSGQFRKRISRTQITGLIRELSMVLSAGVQLSVALELLATDAQSKHVAALARALDASLADGTSFHEALAAHPEHFDAYVVSMVQVGEASGTLPSTLEQVADAREHEQRLRSKVLSAVLYPFFLIVTAILAVVILLTIVVPRFKVMIANVKADVPIETQVVIGLSDWVVAHGATTALILAIAIAALIPMLRLRSVRRFLDLVFLSIPGLGHLLRLNFAIQFFRSMATLLGCGVELPQSLRLTKDIFQHRQLGAVIDESYRALRAGQDFTQPLAASGLFPPVAMSLIRVGHETSALANASHRIAMMLEEKLEVALRRTFLVLEPAIILLVSVFVAGVIISIVGAVISVNELVI